MPHDNSQYQTNATRVGVKRTSTGSQYISVARVGSVLFQRSSIANWTTCSALELGGGPFQLHFLPLNCIRWLHMVGVDVQVDIISLHNS